MKAQPLSYEQLESQIAAWAHTQPQVRAVVVVGSRARPEPLVDAWADLDLIVFTSAPTDYAARTDWLAELGQLWLTARAPTNNTNWIPLVAVFADGLNVDLVLTPLPETCDPRTDLSQVLAAAPYPSVFASGIRVLYDQTEGRTVPQLPQRAPYLATLPSAAAFANEVRLFWVRAVHTAKLVRRGDLWQASHILNCELRQQLLSLLEWHARVTYGAAHRIWPRGRCLDAWADPRAVAALPSCFARYTATDLWHALVAMCALFHWLSAEVAARLGYPDLSKRAGWVRAWLDALAPGESA